jgi:hypothetical protein
MAWESIGEAGRRTIAAPSWWVALVLVIGALVLFGLAMRDTSKQHVQRVAIRDRRPGSSQDVRAVCAAGHERPRSNRRRPNPERSSLRHAPTAREGDMASRQEQSRLLG